MQLALLVPLIKAREKLFSQLAALKEGVYDASINDIRSQLKSLWSPVNLLAAGNLLFENYQRYQKGIAVRIERIKTNYPKEQSSIETWNEWLAWWNDLELEVNRQDFSGAFNQLYWVLQEFRLSLFSPGIKVVGGGSSKKLQGLFEALEKEISKE